MTRPVSDTHSLLLAVFFMTTLGNEVANATDAKVRLFDMAAIRDSSTLEIDIIQGWHRVDGNVPTRQKLVTINVGEMWPGQDYRMPVRMVVPVDRKAKGFHLTGGNQPQPTAAPFGDPLPHGHDDSCDHHEQEKTETLYTTISLT